jgi:hypothetical protein
MEPTSMAKGVNYPRVLLDVVNRVIREELARIEEAIGRGADRPDDCAERLEEIGRELEEARRGALRDLPVSCSLADANQWVLELIGTTMALVEWRQPVRSIQEAKTRFDRITPHLERVRLLADAAPCRPTGPAEELGAALGAVILRVEEKGGELIRGKDPHSGEGLVRLRELYARFAGQPGTGRSSEDRHEPPKEATDLEQPAAPHPPPGEGRRPAPSPGGLLRFPLKKRTAGRVILPTVSVRPCWPRKPKG